MRIALACTVLAWLAGCSVVPPQAWTFDPARPSQKAALPAQELAALTQRGAQLQLERTEIRARIAGQPDILERQRLYEQLHEVGVELSPLERRLAAAAASP